MCEFVERFFELDELAAVTAINFTQICSATWMLCFCRREHVFVGIACSLNKIQVAQFWL
jgi:hypothetical protein